MSFIMPVSPDGKALYNAGASTADVAALIGQAGGATVKEIKRAFNSDVAFYVIERHAGPNGRRGLRASLTLNGKAHPAFTKASFAALADTDRIAATWAACSKFVNSRHPRSTPAETATIAARSAESKATSAVSVPPAAANVPTVAQAAVKPVVKAAVKKVVKK